jgi:hypothetical protein
MAAPDGKVLVCCHALCEQAAVIAALRARGLWGPQLLDLTTAPDRWTRRAVEPEDGQVDRSDTALAIWKAAIPAEGTLLQTYLASRGLDCPIPPSLRFHTGLQHPSGGRWPTMVGLVTRGVDATPVAIHRTFLAQNGAGKAPVRPVRMMLGPCRGGAVRLGAVRNLLMVGEGIETCLAAMQATGNPAWAALATSGLRNLELPDDIDGVIVLADGDDPGEAAARSCALRWCHEGRRVRIARPPRGLDFNDLLLRNSVLGEERRA